MTLIAFTPSKPSALRRATSPSFSTRRKCMASHHAKRFGNCKGTSIEIFGRLLVWLMTKEFWFPDQSPTNNWNWNRGHNLSTIFHNKTLQNTQKSLIEGLFYEKIALIEGISYLSGQEQPGTPFVYRFDLNMKTIFIQFFVFMICKEYQVVAFCFLICQKQTIYFSLASLFR